jgi:uncharacterized protein YdiU (UPF0061 family)
MTLHIPFDNSYARLPDRFFAAQAPVPVAAPALLALNEPLARDLGLDPAALARPRGSRCSPATPCPEGGRAPRAGLCRPPVRRLEPRSSATAARSCWARSWTAGQRRDIQLKGAGRTPVQPHGATAAPGWARAARVRGLRGHARHGRPTTRALSAVATGRDDPARASPTPARSWPAWREPHPRGHVPVLLRPPRHEALAALTDHVIERHYPGVEGAMGLLRAVTDGRPGSSRTGWPWASSTA